MTKYMLNYIKEIIEDDYAMEVLYYSVRKTILDNDFTLQNCTTIKISDRFIEPPVTININHNVSNQTKTFALLLSIRALMLNKSLLEFCNGDLLMFAEYPSIKLDRNTFFDCMKDNEFHTIFSILKNTYSGIKLNDSDKDDFEESTITPEFRNLPNHYKRIARNEKFMTSEVICDNAFVCNDDIEEYVIQEDIAYVGNTAFSYCPNLRTIIIEREDLLFGKFPIVECDNLKLIKVPIGCENYYKEMLPYYQSIIFSRKTLREKQEVESKLNFDGTANNTKMKNEKCDLCRSTINNTVSLDISNSVNYRNVDKNILDEIFHDEENSYKYFWLLSIITLAKEKGGLTFSFDELFIRMVAQAWPLIFKDKLTFGPYDSMETHLSKIMNVSSLSANSSSISVEKWLHINYNSKARNILTRLFKNIPYIFLTPWIMYVSNDDMIEKSNNSDYDSFYAINNKHIVMDEDWFDFILNNYSEVYSFVKDSFTDYLKKFNNGLALLGFLSRK